MGPSRTQRYFSDDTNDDQPMKIEIDMLGEGLVVHFMTGMIVGLLFLNNGPTCILYVCVGGDCKALVIKSVSDSYESTETCSSS